MPEAGQKKSMSRHGISPMVCYLYYFRKPPVFFQTGNFQRQNDDVNKRINVCYCPRSGCGGMDNGDIICATGSIVTDSSP
jgi:hypothetical protein